MARSSRQTAFVSNAENSGAEWHQKEGFMRTKPKTMTVPEELSDDAVEAALAFIFGLSDKNPGLTLFGADADRVKGFLRRFLTEHKLELIKVGTAARAFSVPVRSRPATKSAPKARPRKPTSWREIVAQRVAAGDNKAVAMSYVAKTRPDLYEANQDRMENQALMARDITRLKSQNEGLRRQLKARAVPIPSVPASTVPYVERIGRKSGVVEQPETESERSRRQTADEKRRRRNAV